MSEPQDIEAGEQERPRMVEPLRPRAVGSPLAMGGGRVAAQQDPRQAPAAQDSATPPERTLGGSSTPDAEPDELSGQIRDRAADQSAEQPTDQPSNLQRAVNGLRMAWPFVQKILPLLDGQVVTAVSNLLTPHPHHAPPVNLAPIENGLNELQARHGELRGQLADQNTSLKRVEDRLESVREATDRNTLEQQELMADLKSVGRKVNVIAVIALLLLAASVAINVVLFLHIQRVLP
jgi:hypothetical protein